MTRSRRRVALRAVISLLAGFVGMQSLASPLEASDTPQQLPTGLGTLGIGLPSTVEPEELRLSSGASEPLDSGIIYYSVDRTFTDAGLVISTLYQGDFAWGVHGLDKYVNFRHDDSRGQDRRILAGGIDG